MVDSITGISLCIYAERIDGRTDGCMGGWKERRKEKRKEGREGREKIILYMLLDFKNVLLNIYKF